MERADRDAILPVLLKRIQNLWCSWEYAPGPIEEILASLVLVHDVCAAWREEVDSYLKYHVLQLAVVDEQLEIPPQWLTRVDYVLNAYHRNWKVFSSSHVVSALASLCLLSSSLAQLPLPELWFLCDILERRRTITEDEANAFAGGEGLMLWQIPHFTRHGRV